MKLMRESLTLATVCLVAVALLGGCGQSTQDPILGLWEVDAEASMEDVRQAVVAEEGEEMSAEDEAFLHEMFDEISIEMRFEEEGVVTITGRSFMGSIEEQGEWTRNNGGYTVTTEELGEATGTLNGDRLVISIGEMEQERMHFRRKE